MKLLTRPSNSFEIISEESTKEIQFGIRKEDEGKILEILRSKMYEDPIGSICREISCNSRDANREAKITKPIVIEITNNYLNETSSFIKFIDEGIGISPDRIENIFCNYGASTKTHTNKLTGGFGLGAKTPFSYSDIFYIETVFEKIRYIYSAVLDKTGSGKLVLLSKEIENSKTGTSITIPVKEKDLMLFESKCLTVTQYWKTRPVLTGFQLTYSQLIKKLELDDVVIVENSNSSESGYQIVILIDDIPYKVNSSVIQHDLTQVYSSYLKNFSILVPFNNGELSISSNRETLFYDEQTVRKIKSRLTSVQNSIRSEVELNFNLLSSLKDASFWVYQNKYFVSFIQTITKLDLTQWKNQKILTLDFNSTFQFQTYYLSENNSGEFQIQIKKLDNFEISKNSLLNKIYFQDERFNKRKFKTIYDENIQYFQDKSVCITVLTERKKLNRYESKQSFDVDLKVNKKKVEVFELDLINFSSIQKSTIKKTIGVKQVANVDPRISFRYLDINRFSDKTFSDQTFSKKKSELLQEKNTYYYFKEVTSEIINNCRNIRRIGINSDIKMIYINKKFQKHFQGVKLIDDLFSQFQNKIEEILLFQKVYNQLDENIRYTIKNILSFADNFPGIKSEILTKDQLELFNNIELSRKRMLNFTERFQIDDDSKVQKILDEIKKIISEFTCNFSLLLKLDFNTTYTKQDQKEILNYIKFKINKGDIK